MTAHPAAPLLAADLGRLPHTNARGEQGLIHVPGFLSTTGMSEEQSAEAGLLAQAIAEGVIEDLQKHGYEVIAKADIEASVRAAAAERQTTDEITLYCNRCQRPVIQVDVSGPAPRVHLKTAIMGMQAHVEMCR